MSIETASIEAPDAANDAANGAGANDAPAIEAPGMAIGSDAIAAPSLIEAGAVDAHIAEGSGPHAALGAPGAVDATPWQPTMPPLQTASVPWRRTTVATRAYVVPTLVIDDADPDSADRERDQRTPKDQRLSFLPPILLDREDRSARQGGLTLAVIILLIAATLTLSYLMRRPNPSGDGVTTLDGTPTLLA
jgi:hypothetical protein